MPSKDSAAILAKELGIEGKRENVDWIKDNEIDSVINWEAFAYDMIGRQVKKRTEDALIVVGNRGLLESYQSRFRRDHPGKKNEFISSFKGTGILYDISSNAYRRVP